jgi:hypothetical protein
MKMNSWKMTFIAGLLTVLAFINLSCFSWSLFPGEFTPSNHFFSDLGVNLLNPRGAIYYKLALILSGIGLYFFFLGLKVWHKESRNGIANIMIGSLVGISFVAKGFNVYPIVNDSLLCIAMFLTGTGLLNHPKMPKWISVFSITAGLIYLISTIFHPIWLSWLITLSWLLFVTFISFRTKKAFG